MSDDRPVATDALATLGTAPIPDTSGRDAIHLAVEPVIAGQRVYAGDDIVIRDGSAYLAEAGKGVGIADPFVQGHISKGQKFWLVLYPRQITSLRHVWSHPAFPDEGPAPKKQDRSYSEQWMRRWALVHMSVDYDGDGDFLDEDDAYKNAIEAGHDMSVGPYEDASDHIDNEWWGHWEAITGKPGKRGEYFSCGC